MSNKTPKANVKKTRSGPSLTGIIIIALVAGVVLSFLTSFTFESSQKQVTTPVTSSCLETSNGCYTLERRDTSEERSKGLSGRDGLPDKTAMLFVFERPSTQCFWMKDMKFNIDMVWINEQKQVVAVKQSVSPDTYPESFCQDNTKYVLEFSANETQKLNITTGKRLTF